MHSPTPEQPNNLPTVAKPRMTAAERNELKTLVNERARLAITQVRALAADRLVELNRQLEKTWRAEDLHVAEVVQELEKRAQEENARVKARYNEMGVHPDKRRYINVAFAGGYVTKEREARLRQMAKDENDAAIKRATHQIDTWKLQTRTELVRDGLTSEAAMSFLETLPSPAELLPAITTGDLTKAVNAKRGSP